MTESASILLVEDSNTQALQMRILLEREGFKVARAASAEAALEMMAEARPDLLLVDYHLPGMNGDELVRQVRLNLRTRALPILMLTGGPTRERELQGLDSGASAYVTKSSDPALLIGQLRALLRQRGASSESSAPVGFQRGALMLIASDPACRRAFEPLLEAEGYRALFADDAATAVLELAARPVDCVLVDIGFGGEEALRPLADIAAFRTGARTFEVIALGEDPQGSKLKLRGFAAGADEVLLKSEDRETQAARIRAVVRRKLARDEDQRAAEHERQREAALAAGAIIGTWNWDLLTDRFKVDDAFARSFGLDPSLGRDGIPLAKIVATVHPDDQAGLTAAIDDAIKRGGGYAHQYRTRRADGVYYWLEANGRVHQGPDGTPLGFSGVLIDMEERRALIEERDRAHNELRLVANTLPFLVTFVDNSLTCRFANAAYRQWFDLPIEDVLGRTIAELAGPERYAAQSSAIEQAVAGEATQIDLDWPWPDGRRRIAEVRYVPRRDGNDAVNGLCIFAQDVTTLRDAATLLNARNATLEDEAVDRMAELRLYRDIVFSDASPILAFDKDYRLIGFNQAHADDFMRVMGHRQVVGEILPDFFPQAQSEMLRGYMDRALAGERFVVSQDFGDPERVVPSWEITYTPLRNEAGDIIGAFHHARDISDRTRIARERDELEEQLRQAQKMEAVGQLTGGLAHDFNNLLAGISGSLELMATRISQGRIKDIEKYMVAAQGAARRAAALTHRLLAFSRRQTLAPKATDVNTLVGGMLDLIRRTVGPSVQVETVCMAGLWAAMVDPPQLENALLNLCINARDAMPGGGRITIETGNRWMDRHGARQHDMPEDNICRCASPTPAPACRPKSSPRPSTRSSRPSRSARAPGSACR